MKKTAFFTGCLLVFAPFVLAEYMTELQQQIDSMKRRYPASVDEMYFHDMGVIAHKADEAELYEYTNKIIRENLFPKMEIYVTEAIREINQMYLQDRFAASKKLMVLMEYRKYFQPTREFLDMAQGKTLAGEMALERKRQIESYQALCTADQNIRGIQTLRKAGLFVTNQPEEIMSLRTLAQEVDCCVRWKQKIHYRYERPFESTYEAGILEEEARLNLVSPANDLNQAKWTGEWIYRMKGRDGTAEAVSQAVLTFHKGEDTADFTMSDAKVSSVGRFNFPMQTSGQRKTIEVEGAPLNPLILFDGMAIALTGCHENEI